MSDIIKDNKVSSLSSYSEDDLRNLANEIFFEGFVAGYRHACDLLGNLRSGLFFAATDEMKEFCEKNMDKIWTRAKHAIDTAANKSEEAES